MIDRRTLLTAATAGLGAAILPRPLFAARADGLATLSAADMTSSYAAGRLSPVEVARAVLARIDALNPKIGAFLFVDHEGVLASARESEARWRSGSAFGPLDGIPISTKDFMSVSGMPSPDCLPLPNAYHADAQDAPYVAKLRRAGALLTGKTAQPQNIMMGSGGAICPVYGNAHNPWKLSRSPGGSSAGAGAAAAAAMGPLHLGMDGGGSIRIPASYCGMAAYKHSRGFVSLPGLPGNNCLGPISPRLDDIIRMMSVLSDMPFEVRAWRPTDPSRIRIGYCRWVGDRALRPTAPVAKAVGEAVEKIRDLGYSTADAPPFVPDGFWRALTRGFLGSNGQSYGHKLADAGVIDRLGPITRKGLKASGRVSPATFQAEVAAFPKILARMNDPFKIFDFLITATMPTVAHSVSRDWPAEVTPDPMLGIGTDHLLQTAIFNFTGNPAVSLNCGFDRSGLPIGLQIAGRVGEDVALIAFASTIEALLGDPPALPFLRQ